VLELAPGAQATSGKVEGVPAFGNVFVIIGENTDYQQVTANNSPYLVGTIKPQSAWLTNYWATTHYSESNYVAMTSGQFTPCEQADGSIAPCHQQTSALRSTVCSMAIAVVAGSVRCETSPGRSASLGALEAFAGPTQKSTAPTMGARRPTLSPPPRQSDLLMGHRPPSMACTRERSSCALKGLRM